MANIARDREMSRKQEKQRLLQTESRQRRGGYSSITVSYFPHRAHFVGYYEIMYRPTLFKTWKEFCTE